MANSISAGLKKYAFSAYQKVKSIGSEVADFFKWNDRKDEVDNILNAPDLKAYGKIKNICSLNSLKEELFKGAVFCGMLGAFSLLAAAKIIAAAVAAPFIVPPLLLGLAVAAAGGDLIHRTVQLVQADRCADRKILELNNQSFLCQPIQANPARLRRSF